MVFYAILRAKISLTKKGRINKSNAKKEVKLEYFK